MAHEDKQSSITALLCAEKWNKGRCCQSTLTGAVVDVKGGSGSGYLSFMAKCVSNPVSCVTLGGSDPPQPADPAVPSLSFNF